MRLLLTGFEPFDGQQVNASWSAVAAVAADWTGDDDLTTGLLPVSYARAPEMLRALCATVRPDAVLCVGEAGGRARIGIEQVAVNRADAEIADNDDARPDGVQLLVGAPASYRSGFPLEECLGAVQAAGVPVELSPSAGTFVCNAVFFAAAHLAEVEYGTPGTRRPRVGFVHVPRTPEQVQGGGPSLPVADSARAIRAVLSVVSAAGG